MTIFEEMYDHKSVESHWHYSEILRMLSEAIKRGHVEEISVAAKQHAIGDRWFRETETGVVYRLQCPDERSSGHWSLVEPKDLFPDIPLAGSTQTPQ